jgi:hypothetical protein
MKDSQTAYFSSFMLNATVSTNVGEAPFIPTALFRQTMVRQANDPLVHYLTDDLRALNPSGPLFVFPPHRSSPGVTDTFRKLSTRYSPWGGIGHTQPEPISASIPTGMTPRSKIP